MLDYLDASSDALDLYDNWLMETANERRKRRLQQLCDRDGGVKAVAARANVNPASLDQILKGTLLPPKADGSRSPRNLGDELARKIESAWGLRVGWFDSDDGHFVTNDEATEPLAQSVSHPPITLPPKRLQWSEVVNAGQLPIEFQVEAPDDACRPDIRAGWLLQCSPEVSPEPGDYVIVRDAAARPPSACMPKVPRGRGKLSLRCADIGPSTLATTDSLCWRS